MKIIPSERLKIWNDACEYEMNKSIPILHRLVSAFYYLYPFQMLQSNNPICAQKEGHSISNMFLCYNSPNTYNDKRIIFLHVPFNRYDLNINVGNISHFNVRHLSMVDDVKQEQLVYGLRSFAYIDYLKSSYIKIVILSEPIMRIFNYYVRLHTVKVPPSCTTFRRNTTFSSWYLRNFKRIPDINNYEVRLLTTMSDSLTISLTSDVQCFMHYRYCTFPPPRSKMPSIQFPDITNAAYHLKTASFVGCVGTKEYKNKTLHMIQSLYSNLVTDEATFFEHNRRSDDYEEFLRERHKIESDNWASVEIWNTALHIFDLEWERFNQY